MVPAHRKAWSTELSSVPNNDIIKRDFNRFGFLLNLSAAHAMGPQC